MIRFDVVEPENLPEACSMLAEHGEAAKIIAGGQNMLVLLRERVIRPRYLVNINNGRLDMAYIREEGDILKLGALTTHRTVEKSDIIREKLPMLAEVEYKLGCIQTRNWGTIGGNLCQASPTNDLAPALIALGACCLLKSKTGERIVPLNDFFVGYHETELKPDEILVEIQVPKPARRTGGTYRKESVRFADPPIASVGVVVRLDEQGAIAEARIVLQAVGVTPLRAQRAEAALIGEKMQDKLLDTAAALAAEEACPISDIYGSEQYKREMVKILTRHSIREAIQRAQAA